MINVQSTPIRHKVFFTMTTIFVVMLMCAYTASASEWPEEDIGEDFWYDILKISEETPSFMQELGGPTAIVLPFAQEPTEVRWMTEGDVTIYLHTDHWELLASHGATAYKDDAIVAFLPNPTAGGFAYIGTEIFDVSCGGVEANLTGEGKTTTSGRSTSKAIAESAAENQAYDRASTDSNLAVAGYDECPETCKKPVRGIWWSNVTSSGSSYSYWNSFFDEISRYSGWAKYEWQAYVVCVEPST